MARILSDAIITEELYYVICAILSFLVLFGIYLMSKGGEKAPLGNALSATALGLGIILTLVHKEILTVWVLYPALALGACHRPDPCAPCQDDRNSPVGGPIKWRGRGSFRACWALCLP